MLNKFEEAHFRENSEKISRGQRDFRFSVDGNFPWVFSLGQFPWPADVVKIWLSGNSKTNPALQIYTMSLKRDFISRVQKELKQLQSLKPHGIEVTLPSDSLQIWEAVVPGSEESLYKGGRFKVQVYLPENYPLGPPTVRFLSPIYHLNVCPATGHVCLGFLSEATWLPTRCVQDLLSALFALLIRPEPEIAADQTLLNMYNQNRTVYEEKARKSAREAK